MANLVTANIDFSFETGAVAGCLAGPDDTCPSYRAEAAGDAWRCTLDCFRHSLAPGNGGARRIK